MQHFRRTHPKHTNTQDNKHTEAQSLRTYVISINYIFAHMYLYTNNTNNTCACRYIQICHRRKHSHNLPSQETTADGTPCLLGRGELCLDLHRKMQTLGRRRQPEARRAIQCGRWHGQPRGQASENRGSESSCDNNDVVYCMNEQSE